MQEEVINKKEEEMKKGFLVALVFAVVVAIPFVAYAEGVKDMTGKTAVGLVAGGVFPKDNDIDNTWYLGGNFAYGINEYFAVGAEVGYTLWEDEEAGVDYGDIRAVPLLADVYLRYPTELGAQTVIPYIIGGIGVVFWDYDESSLLENNSITVNMDNSLGVKIGGGVDYFVSNNVALNLEGFYLWSEADASISAFGTYAAATVDTDSWIVTGGLKYYF